MSNMKHEVKSITRVYHAVTLMEKDILEWLSRKEGAAKNSEITIEVPRGGDCSGQTLKLDECGGLTVMWTEEIKE